LLFEGTVTLWAGTSSIKSCQEGKEGGQELRRRLWGRGASVRLPGAYLYPCLAYTLSHVQISSCIKYLSTILSAIQIISYKDPDLMYSEDAVH